MKFEVDSPDDVARWLDSPRPAIFQGQDLLAVADEMAARDLSGCAFLGCRMTPALLDAAAKAECLILPCRNGLPFAPFRSSLYSAEELFDKFDPAEPASLARCLDWQVYLSFIDPATKHEVPVDLDIALMRRLHDASISDALHEILDDIGREKAVAIMGGHAVPRSLQGRFAEVAHLALELKTAGFLVVTGGGPGLMEAANLGAYAAGFEHPQRALAAALAALEDAPLYDPPPLWLAAAFAAKKAMGPPRHPDHCVNVGIPTWFYGHEPPNIFATHIAKYFENSVREEGMLALALGGVVFAEGNAGTVQEIFQDACQNYYRTFRGLKSPMILLGKNYWNPDVSAPGYEAGRSKPAYPLLQKLAQEKSFEDYLLLTDDIADVAAFLKSHPPS